MFIRSIDALPFGWDDDPVEAWPREGDAKRVSRALVVSDRGNSSGGELFATWFAGLPEKPPETPACLIVVHAAAEPLPPPTVRVIGGSCNRLASHIQEITLPPAALLPGRAVEIARYDGIVPSDIRVSLR